MRVDTDCQSAHNVTVGIHEPSARSQRDSTVVGVFGNTMPTLTMCHACSALAGRAAFAGGVPFNGKNPKLARSIPACKDIRNVGVGLALA